MKILLIVTAALACAYTFAAVVFYYGFKNWSYVCKGKKTPAAPARGFGRLLVRWRGTERDCQ